MLKTPLVALLVAIIGGEMLDRLAWRRHDFVVDILNHFSDLSPLSPSGDSFVASQSNVLSLDVVNKALAWSAQQMYNTYTQLPPNTQPIRVDPGTTGAWKWYNTQMWTAGFFPGKFTLPGEVI